METIEETTISASQVHYLNSLLVIDLSFTITKVKYHTESNLYVGKQNVRKHEYCCISML